MTVCKKYIITEQRIEKALQRGRMLRAQYFCNLIGSFSSMKKIEKNWK